MPSLAAEFEPMDPWDRMFTVGPYSPRTMLAFMTIEADGGNLGRMKIGELRLRALWWLGKAAGWLGRALASVAVRLIGWADRR